MIATNEVKPHCKVCDNGLCPTKVIRAGRASYFCVECGRDVSMAAMLIGEAILALAEKEGA